MCPNIATFNKLFYILQILNLELNKYTLNVLFSNINQPFKLKSVVALFG